MSDYAIPKASQVPWYELDSTVTPRPVNPMGAKGAGEAGTIASTPAVGKCGRRCGAPSRCRQYPNADDPGAYLGGDERGEIAAYWTRRNAPAILTMKGKQKVYPTQFEYVRPTSIDEAVAILAADPDAKVLAGGHSLIPAMKLRLAAPGTIVDIGKIEGLSGVTSNGTITIGALTTYRGIIDADGFDGFPVVQAATKQVGDPAVRNRGTIGGSLAHNDPAADLTAVMLALNASVTAKGPNGARTIPVDDLFVGLLTTSLETDEIITSVSIPQDFAGAKQAYLKHAHPASGYAVVGVAVAITEKDGKVRVGPHRRHRRTRICQTGYLCRERPDRQGP